MSLEEKIPVLAYSPEWLEIYHWKRPKWEAFTMLSEIPDSPVWHRCETQLPAIVCSCGLFLLEQFPPEDGILIPR